MNFVFKQKNDTFGIIYNLLLSCIILMVKYNVLFLFVFSIILTIGLSSCLPPPDDFDTIKDPIGETPSEIVYTAPIIITSGGTYIGNWESTDYNVPAVRIRTGEHIIIKNSNTKSITDHIKSDWGFNANVTIMNTSGVGKKPKLNGNFPGRFVHLDSYSGLILENSYMENTSGVYLHAATDGAIVRIIKNQVRNIDGRRSDGNEGYSGVYYVQFVQLNKGNLHNTEIAWNEVINIPWKSFAEDIISLHEVNGREGDPIRIHNNFLKGAYPLDPATGSFSGGGIMLGDGKSNNKYLHAYNNHVVSTTNYGIAISAGEHNRMYENRIISCGFVINPNTGEKVFVPAHNVGAYIWNIHQVTNFQNNSGNDNAIAWMRTETQRNDWWIPDVLFASS
jgi:hypothetical protein